MTKSVIALQLSAMLILGCSPTRAFYSKEILEERLAHPPGAGSA